MAIIDNLPTKPSQVLSESDKKTLLFGGWLVGGIMLIFSNRYILIDLKFAAPITLVAWQAFVIVFFTQAFALQRKLGDLQVAPAPAISREVYTTFIVPTGILLGLVPIWSTFASRALPLWQIALLQGSTPFLAAGLATTLGSRFPFAKYVWMAGIVVALLISTIGGMKFGKYDTELTEKQLYGAGWTGHERILAQNATLLPTMRTANEILDIVNATEVLQGSQAALVSTGLATICGIFAVGADAGSKVLMEALLKARTGGMTASRLLLHIAPIWFLVVAVASAVLETPSVSSFLTLPTGILFANGFAAVLLAFSVPAIIQMTSASTFLLADSFKQTFVTFLACVVYNIPIGLWHAFSYFVGFAAFSKYAEKEVPAEGQLGPADYAMVTPNTSAEVDDTENNTPEPSHYEKVKVAEATGATVNMFVLLCGLLLAVLVTASMTTRPVLSSAQALKYEQAVVPYEQSKIATIIEPRNIPHLGPLILQFLSVLPSDWPVLAWVSPENIEVLRQIPAISRYAEQGRLELRLLPHQFDIHNGEYLSRFLTKPWFWETMEQEWILFFQSDSVLCSKSPQHIDDWIGFDWVGAPWHDSVDAHGGNGGLSIRKRSSMIKLTSNPDIAREDYGDPEDVWFSRHLEELPGVRWPTEHQAKFSVENLFGTMHEWSWRPLGVHSGGIPPSSWRTEDIMTRLMDWCPELKLFYDPRKYLGT